jgi:ABC-type Fe2+-enterobactin transport system substrate-binding protein
LTNNILFLVFTEDAGTQNNFSAQHKGYFSWITEFASRRKLWYIYLNELWIIADQGQVTLPSFLLVISSVFGIRVCLVLR